MAIPRLRNNLHRRGVALVYAAALIVVVIGFIGLAVDVGRAQYAKAQLQVLADVAARAAARGIADNTTLARANAVANYNAPDGGAITFAAGDVETGNWNTGTKTFTAGGTPTNAVRVTAARTSAKGNALPMHFLQLLGSGTADISSSAVATGSSGLAAHGVVGLNWVKLYSSVQIDSYDSSVGAYNASWTPDHGNVASNGPIQLDPGVTIRGDARPGPGNSASGGTVTGSRTPLTSTLSYPAPSADGYGPSNNNNTNIPAAYRSGQNFSVTTNVTVTLPAGNYYFNNFTMTNASVLNVTGAATVYIAGDLYFDGDSRTSAHRPQNLKFVMLGSGSDDVRLIGNNGVYANIYAPHCDVTLDSNKHLYGMVIARKIDAHSNSRIHVDESLVAANGGGSTVVQVVK
jgi:Flp pilus assembly protein TadG